MQFLAMNVVYMLKGASGRYYMGSTSNLPQRLEARRRGNTATTKRLSHPLIVAASREFESATEARRVERMLKAWKNPAKALAYLAT
ncbi:MAG: GIY-YIG nuclease family protein [Terrimicrobiaceae bacterium]|nr:GIY-YIG nuclease family protein [Terrimicrobiaceae bacterium]